MKIIHTSIGNRTHNSFIYSQTLSRNTTTVHGILYFKFIFIIVSTIPVSAWVDLKAPPVGWNTLDPPGLEAVIPPNRLSDEPALRNIYYCNNFEVK